MKFLHPLTPLPFQGTEAEVPGLTEGKDYMFRVRAVNSEGESEPLETDTAIKAKNPYGEREAKAQNQDIYITSYKNINGLFPSQPDLE